MKTLSIDIETYSDVDLRKCGVYKYAESPGFEVLLFGYAFDGGEVQVADLSRGDEIPPEIINALTDDAVTKWAFNAAFERICLSRFLGYPPGEYLSPESWRCSMVWAATLGLPLSLEGVGSVLGLEKQKLNEGKDLIRYFCVPCTPTKTNGGRTRNKPFHAPDKWDMFKKYNKRDVETEMGIQKRLDNFPVPDSVWDEYHIDQEINDRGVKLDMDLVHRAIDMDSLSREELISSMKKITELENPNSVMQMRQWLSDNGLETESLDKKAVNELIKDAPENLANVLTLRKQLAKSSVKKYQAMKNTVCSDGRARGMFFFNGANRTGRWCLTGDHEVLTKNGWERLDSWNGGSIACWNPHNEIVSFQKANALCFDYSGPMYTYTDARIDQCSTPDHKMRAKKRYDLEWQDMTVEEMSKGRPCIPMTGCKNYRCCADPAWLRVLIMTQADGYYTEEGVLRYHFKKPRKIERCKMLLRKAEIAFQERSYAGGVTVIEVPSRCVPLWLRQFTDKTFGFWLFDENPDIFFDELPHWDGYYPAPNSIQYSTINKRNADIVQALAHMSGRTAVIHEKKPGKSNWSLSYVVDIWQKPTNSHEIKAKPSISDFTGKVYCAETSTGYFLVRRNGKVWVTGNSGKLIQIQNLPQNHMPDLNEARALVRSGNYDGVKLLYEDVPDTLSQLIRTAFIPHEGKKFIVADFSAIEARVIAWFADEEWRMNAFKNGEDIYCASASKMFCVPVEKHGINGHLRQKGKISELACIAEGELVLTDHGLIPIEHVTTDDKVWDGSFWVTHKGVIYKGEREVITYDGLTATPDHPVYIDDQENPIQFGAAAACKKHILQTGSGERAVWHALNFNSGVTDTSVPKVRFSSVYDILDAGPQHRFTVSGKLVHNCGYGGSVGAMKAMGGSDLNLTDDELQKLVDDWREANPKIVSFWWDVDHAVTEAVRYKVTTKTHGLVFTCKSGMLFITLPSGRKLAYVKPKIGTNQFGGTCITYEGIGATKKWERLESYGPKFVENIVQGTSRDILCYAMKTLRHCSIVMHVHDELIIEADPEMSVDEICEQMSRTPPWAKGLLLKADGYETDFYKKD